MMTSYLIFFTAVAQWTDRVLEPKDSGTTLAHEEDTICLSDPEASETSSWYHDAEINQKKFAMYDFDVEKSGCYAIHMWHPDDCLNVTFTDMLPVKVTWNHAYTEDVVCVHEMGFFIDQTQEGGQWNMLGRFPFTKRFTGHINVGLDKFCPWWLLNWENEHWIAPHFRISWWNDDCSFPQWNDTEAPALQEPTLPPVTEAPATEAPTTEMPADKDEDDDDDDDHDHDDDDDDDDDEPEGTEESDHPESNEDELDDEIISLDEPIFDKPPTSTRSPLHEPAEMSQLPSRSEIVESDKTERIDVPISGCYLLEGLFREPTELFVRHETFRGTPLVASLSSDENILGSWELLVAKFFTSGDKLAIEAKKGNVEIRFTYIEKQCYPLNSMEVEMKGEYSDQEFNYASLRIVRNVAKEMKIRPTRIVMQKTWKASIHAQLLVFGDEPYTASTLCDLTTFHDCQSAVVSREKVEPKLKLTPIDAPATFAPVAVIRSIATIVFLIMLGCFVLRKLKHKWHQGSNADPRMNKDSDGWDVPADTSVTGIPVDLEDAAAIEDMIVAQKGEHQILPRGEPEPFHKPAEPENSDNNNAYTQV